EHASIADGALRYDRTVEPLTNYSVGRVRREFSNQSSVGFILTATSRQLTDEVRFLAKDAVAGGADFDWRFRKRYSLNGYWAGSDVSATHDAIEGIEEDSHHYFQRPGFAGRQVDPAATSLTGTAGRLSIGKIAGERTRFNSTLAYK